MYFLGAQALNGHTNDNVRYQGLLHNMSLLGVGKDPCLTFEVSNQHMLSVALVLPDARNPVARFN